MDDEYSPDDGHDQKATSSDSEPESMDGDTGCDSPWPSTHVSEQRQLHARRISVPPAVETQTCDATYMCSYLDKQACHFFLYTRSSTVVTPLLMLADLIL